MLNKIKEKNQEILQNHFQEVFGEESVVTVNWGFPVTSVKVAVEKEEEKTIWVLAFNVNTEDFEISTYASKMEEGVEVPAQVTVSKQVIDFIIKRTAEITEHFFTTREVDAPAQEEVQESAVEEPKQA